MASPLKYFKPIQLLKRGWNEIPDIIAGSVLAISSLIGMVCVYQYKSSQGKLDHKRYRLEYTVAIIFLCLVLVVRPDDPLAKQSPQFFDYSKAFGTKN